MGERQKALDIKGYGHLGLGVAGAIMLVVVCPMGIIAVASPYWTFSSEVQDNSVSAKVSLWEVSMSTEIRGTSSESQVDMCAEEMQGFDECGKIHALRFFVITALLLSFASAITMIVGFLPVLKPTEALRRKLSIAGVSLAAFVLLGHSLSVCIAISVKMQDNYSLSGAGFVFLVMNLFFVILAHQLVICTLTLWSAPTAATETVIVGAQKAQSQAAQDGAHTLPTLVGQRQSVVAWEKDATPAVPTLVGQQQNNVNVEKDDQAEKVDAAEIC